MQKRARTRTREESEKALERRLVKEIQARGGWCLKHTSQYHRGIPDRIILLPSPDEHPRTLFVELKSTGRKPSKLQLLAMSRLGALGYPCYVIDSTDTLITFLNVIDQ